MNSNNEYNSCWLYFKIDGKNKNISNCTICNKQIACKGGCTTGLHRHLERKHQMRKILKQQEPVSKQVMSESDKIEKYFPLVEQISVEEIISEMVAHNNMSVNQITNCDYIRRSLRKYNYTLSTFDNTSNINPERKKFLFIGTLGV